MTWSRSFLADQPAWIRSEPTLFAAECGLLHALFQLLDVLGRLQGGPATSSPKVAVKGFYSVMIYNLLAEIPLRRLVWADSAE